VAEAVRDLLGRCLRHGGSPSWYGDGLPSRDFPALIDLYLQGRFGLGDFVTETIALDEGQWDEPTLRPSELRPPSGASVASCATLCAFGN
jgi:hypothetical protein